MRSTLSAVAAAAAFAVVGVPTAASAQVVILQSYEDTTVDDLGTNNELFLRRPGLSGSNLNVAGTSAADSLTLVSPGLGPLGGDQALDVLVEPGTDGAGSPQRVRFLVNSTGNIDENFATSGTAGFLLQVPEGAPADLEVGLVVEDTGRADLEVLSPTAVISDGTTVLYEFNIEPGTSTTTFDEFFLTGGSSLGTGMITGETYNIDSIAFRTQSTDTFNFTIDNVAVNPSGDLSVLIPEPTSLALLGTGGLCLLRRRRA